MGEETVSIYEMNIYEKLSKIAQMSGVKEKNKSGFNFKYTTEDEILALRWFRGSYEVGNVLDYQKQKCYLLADAKCPLIRLLSAADISAIAIERQKTMEYDISKFGE